MVKHVFCFKTCLCGRLGDDDGDGDGLSDRRDRPEDEDEEGDGWSDGRRGLQDLANISGSSDALAEQTAILAIFYKTSSFVGNIKTIENVKSIETIFSHILNCRKLFCYKY